MGFPSFVFHHVHPMVGLDIENNLLPPPVGPVPPKLPYMSITVLSGNYVQAEFTKKSYALSEGIRIMQKGTDCGWLGVPHVGSLANLLYPVILGFSKSKSHFGCASVKFENKPVAIAIGPIGLNLNCGMISTPTGMVVPPTTVFAGMTWGDFIFGCINIAVDMLWDKIIKRVFKVNALSNGINSLAARIMGRVWGSAVSKVLPDSLIQAHKLVATTVEKLTKKGTEQWIKLGVGGIDNPQSVTSAVEGLVRDNGWWKRNLESPPSDTYSMF